ncbi:hypothetical protein B0H14DRAFT_3137612 [Mycena olivaceomarginata]|nr:hypothetical protein B0H14DRAFT_3137612 [Mycena olivaceomarginata]
MKQRPSIFSRRERWRSGYPRPPHSGGLSSSHLRGCFRALPGLRAVSSTSSPPMRPTRGISPNFSSSRFLGYTPPEDRRPVASPFATAPHDLFFVYLLHLVGGVLLLGGRLFDYAIGETSLPSTPTLVGLSANLVTILVLLYFTVIMPMDLPSTRVKKRGYWRACLSGGLHAPVGMDHLQLGVSPYQTRNIPNAQ